MATYDVAIERLRQRFHLGLVAPGSKLPSERRLAEELNVARATLREALRVLAAEGYVEIRRGVAGGAIVPEHATFLEIIQKRARGDVAARFRALEFWEVVQTAAAPLAAERRNPATLKVLRNAGERLTKTREDAWQRRAAETELCLTVAAASGNPWLTNAVYDSLAATFLPFAESIGAKTEFPPESVKALVDAVDRSDQMEARQQMAAIARIYASRLRPKRHGPAAAGKEFPAAGSDERGPSTRPSLR